jgi:hypothetical protein
MAMLRFNHLTGLGRADPGTIWRYPQHDVEAPPLRRTQ